MLLPENTNDSKRLAWADSLHPDLSIPHQTLTTLSLTQYYNEKWLKGHILDFCEVMSCSTIRVPCPTEQDDMKRVPVSTPCLHREELTLPLPCTQAGSGTQVKTKACITTCVISPSLLLSHPLQTVPSDVFFRPYFGCSDFFLIFSWMYVRNVTGRDVRSCFSVTHLPHITSICYILAVRLNLVASRSGMSLADDTQREYVRQLSKGCYPGVVNTPGGGRCHLPGWPEAW